MAPNASRHYMQQQLNTASPAMLVAMLYDRAINFLKEAVRAIEAGEIEARWKANNKAIEIITHMWMTLDLDKGGEIAANLDRLYRFMLNHLTQVDMKNDAKAAQDVIALLEPLHASWRRLANGETPASADTAEGDAGPAAESINRLSLSA